MRYVHFPTVSGSPDSAAWHTWRRGGIGGSDAATIAFNAGLLKREESASWQRDYAGLLAEKRGEPRPDRDNFAMRRGKALEPIIKATYEAQTGIPVQPIFGEQDEHPFIRSSFDGAALGLDVLVEIKAANIEVHEAAKAGLIIPYYRPQVAHQALTAWGHPDTWDLSREMHFVNHYNGETVIAVVPAGDDGMRRLAEALQVAHLAFWKEVEEGRYFPPEVLDAAREFKRLKLLEKEIEAQLSKYGAEIERYAKSLGVPKLELEGVRASEVGRKGSVDFFAVLKSRGIEIAEPDLEAFRKPGTTSWMVSLAAPAGGAKSRKDKAA